MMAANTQLFILLLLAGFSSRCVNCCLENPSTISLLNYVATNYEHTVPQISYNVNPLVSKNALYCQVENETKRPCLGDIDVAKLKSLVEQLEEDRYCIFDEQHWMRVKESIVKLTKSELITKENEPDVYIIPDFLTNQQCEELVNIHESVSKNNIINTWMFSTTQQLLEAVHKASLSPLEYNFTVGTSENSCDGGTIVGEGIGQKLMKVMNFSSSVLIPRGENTVVDEIEKHVQKVVGLPKTNAFHTQLLKYQKNSQYKEHTDCHVLENDRMATIIIYLTDVEEGGETFFPYLKTAVKPKRGMAVVWKNLDNSGECDVRTTHVAGTVNKGTKYVYQKWFYENPILPQYQKSDFTSCDLSLSCRQYIYNKSTEAAVQFMNSGNNCNKYSDALRYYESALRHQPHHAASLILYADALVNLGYRQLALPYLLKVLKMHPRNANAIEIVKKVVREMSS